MRKNERKEKELLVKQDSFAFLCEINHRTTTTIIPPEFGPTLRIKMAIAMLLSGPVPYYMLHQLNCIMVLSSPFFTLKQKRIFEEYPLAQYKKYLKARKQEIEKHSLVMQYAKKQELSLLDNIKNPLP